LGNESTKVIEEGLTQTDGMFYLQEILAMLGNDASQASRRICTWLVTKDDM